MQPPAQTIKQAKAEYKKHGPRISVQEQRRLDRDAELLTRAEKIREAERKRKAAKQRRLQKEEKEREARRTKGLPSQPPPPKVPASQQLLQIFAKPVNQVIQVEGYRIKQDAIDEESWESCFESSTQIQRDISPSHLASVATKDMDFGDILSSQDVQLSQDDVEEIGLEEKVKKVAIPFSRATPLSKELHVVPSDFELSSQDYREIGG